MSDRSLVDAALDVIANHGLDGVTVDRLAEASGISRATLYRRGVAIDELTAAAVEKAAEQYREALWPALTGPGSAANRLEAALRALCEAADQHLALLVGLYPHPHSPFHEEVDGAALVQEPFAEPFERLLRDGITDGTLRSRDPAADATLLFNLVSWTYVHLRHAHHWPPEEASTRVVSLVLGGVLRGEN
ncbi:MAG: TetR/AcrR family transcriptional regulator [Actinobacteria bacterium]|jgi:AcrR family transcriptional regulator|nr:TetR/AcrR family transcriptional regulator [Actinomycetota bacterium]